MKKHEIFFLENFSTSNYIVSADNTNEEMKQNCIQFWYISKILGGFYEFGA